MEIWETVPVAVVADLIGVWIVWKFGKRFARYCRELAIFKGRGKGDDGR